MLFAITLIVAIISTVGFIVRSTELREMQKTYNKLVDDHMKAVKALVNSSK